MENVSKYFGDKPTDKVRHWIYYRMVESKEVNAALCDPHEGISYGCMCKVYAELELNHTRWI